MSYPDDDDDQIPETGAVFTFGKSRFADNIANKFWIKNDPIVNIACGDEHSAVVTESGRLYVFGSNDWGQLGLGHTKSLNKPSFVKALKPEKIKQVACGRNHTLVYSESGKIFSFGCNEDGQLGHAEKNNELLPKEIEYLSPMKMKQIACGTYHSVALSEDGDVYVWGNNNEGQLGIGEGVEKILPKKLKFKKEVVSVSCGYYHTALVTRDGFLYTFGEDELGKLGLSGPQLNDTTLPQPVAAPSNNDGYISVSCGARHTVAVTKQGHCYAWGDGSQGQLGHGTKLLEVNEPKQIDKLSGHKCISVSCGESHTAVITASGKIFTFGDGRHGKLGQGEESFSNIFNPVYLSRFNFFNVISVSCGGCHMLVQAVHRNKDDIIDGEDSLMASITSQKSLKEANMTLRPGNTTFPSPSPRDKRRLKDGNSGIDKTLNKSVSLNSSMTMAQLNRTMPELPSRLDKSKLPKIPGLNPSDNDYNGSNNHLYNGRSRQSEDRSSLSSVENENKKNKRLVSEVSFSRTAKVKNNPEDNLLNNHKKKDSVVNKNLDSDEDEDDLLKRQQVQILSSKSINSNESSKSLNKVKNSKSKHTHNSVEEEEENEHTDFSKNKQKNFNDKLKKQNKVDIDNEEDEENISTDKELSQKHLKSKSRDKKKVSLEDENSEEEIKYKTKQGKLNKPNSYSKDGKNKKRFIEDDNDDDDDDNEEEESEEDNRDVEDDENNENSEESEEENNHKSNSKVTTNKSKSIMQNKPKSIEKIKSKSVFVEKLKSKLNEKTAKNGKNKLEINKDKKRTNHKSKEPSEDEDEDDEEENDNEENDNEEEHSEDEEEEEEGGDSNNDEDEDEEENEEDDDENNENNSDNKKGVKLKNDKDLDNDKNKDKKTRFLNFFRRKKQQTDTQREDDNETSDNQKSKACVIL